MGVSRAGSRVGSALAVRRRRGIAGGTRGGRGAPGGLRGLPGRAGRSACPQIRPVPPSSASRAALARTRPPRHPPTSPQRNPRRLRPRRNLPRRRPGRAGAGRHPGHPGPAPKLIGGGQPGNRTSPGPASAGSCCLGRGARPRQTRGGQRAASSRGRCSSRKPSATRSQPGRRRARCRRRPSPTRSKRSACARAPSPSSSPGEPGLSCRRRIPTRGRGEPAESRGAHRRARSSSGQQGGPASIRAGGSFRHGQSGRGALRT